MWDQPRDWRMVSYSTAMSHRVRGCILRALLQHVQAHLSVYSGHLIAQTAVDASQPKVEEGVIAAGEQQVQLEGDLERNFLEGVRRGTRGAMGLGL